MIDDVKPGNHVDEEFRESGVPGCNALQIGRHLRGPVQRLSFLDFTHHFLHVHINLPRVFREAIETIFVNVSRATH